MSRRYYPGVPSLFGMRDAVFAAAAVLILGLAMLVLPATKPATVGSDFSARTAMSNRRKILYIGSSFLPMVMGRGVRPYAITSDPLPDDVRIVNCRMSDDFHTLVLLLESSEFDEVRDGEPYPRIEPIFTEAKPCATPTSP